MPLGLNDGIPNLKR